MENIPACISAAFARLPDLWLPIPPATLVCCQGGPGQHIRIIKFFAAKDKKHARTALQMWGSLVSLTGRGEAFESEAAFLLADTLRCAPNSPRFHARFTRGDLHALDEKVRASSAATLVAALSEHPELIAQSSSRYWPPHYVETLKAGLRGTSNNFGGALTYNDEPIPRDDDPDATAWYIAHNMPTMRLMLERLCDGARIMHNHRMNQDKVRQTDTSHLLRGLLTGLRDRHPNARASHVAAIAAPIMSFFDPHDFFERAEKMAQRMSRRPKT